ncbi:hypothetical protein BCR42DRAFT_427266 [Absidia repens]|uniref:Uncharacterized protein n=1 Tax=Absidia repens TaxID=90262 RepID=A0A1X2I064_9FUNG|nr:hypothetical protein BCR42DRAFT_427266 [Absidia repens]
MESSAFTNEFMDDENSHYTTYLEAPRPWGEEPPRSYCYPFLGLNLTAFEAKVGDQLCNIQWANDAVKNQLDDYRHHGQGITIANLVLNAITVSCILVYLVYSLYSYCKRPKQPVVL